MSLNRQENANIRSISPKNTINYQQAKKKLSLTPKSLSMNETKNKVEKGLDDYVNKVYQIPQLVKTNKNNKLTVGKEKLRQINRTLDINNQSQRQYQNRLKSNDLFINYDVNPFTKHLLSEKTQQVQGLKSKKINIHLIQTLKKQNFYKKLHSQIQKIEANAKKMPELFTQEKKKTKNKKKNTFTKSFQQFDISSILKDVSFTSFEVACNELQAIVGIRQENFFRSKREREPFNLFEVITNPKSVMFQSGATQLELNKFYFYVQQKINLKQSKKMIDNNLSSFSRLRCLKSNIKNIADNFRLNTKDLSFQIDSLTAYDMLLIASGRLNHNLALQLLQQRQYQINMVNKVQTLYQKHIPYKQNQRNKLNKVSQQSGGKQEIYCWKSMPKTSLQMKQQQISKKYLADMEEVLKQQIQIVNYNILCPNVQQKYEKVKQQIFLKQLEDNSNPIIDLKNKNQKKVSLIKYSKDKCESIKLKIAQTSLENKKMILRFLKKQIKKQSKMESVSKQKSHRKSKSKPKSNPKSKLKPK